MSGEFEQKIRPALRDSNPAKAGLAKFPTEGSLLYRRIERRSVLTKPLQWLALGGLSIVLSKIPDGIKSPESTAYGSKASFPPDVDPQDLWDSLGLLEEPTPLAPALTSTPTFTPTPTFQPTAAPTATPTDLSDRADCDEMRGSPYRSGAERDWFLDNCVSPQDRERALTAPSPEASGSLAAVYRHGDRAVPYIALTIDDGWDLDMVTAALDISKTRGARLTLFPAGRMIDAGPAIFARAVDEGHEIANHTYSHTWLTELSREGILSEIEMAQAALDRALGRHHKMRFLRPPGMAGFTSGDGEPYIRAAIFEKGLSVALWDVDSFYSAIRLGGGAEEVVAAVTTSAQSGSIVLQHFTAADIYALESILNWVDSQGLRPVTISELLGVT